MTLQCLKSLVIIETKINTNLSFYLVPIKMVVLKRRKNNKCWGNKYLKSVSKEVLVGLNEHWYIHYQNQCEGFLKKLKIEQNMGKYEKDSTFYHGRPYTPMFIAAIFTISRKMNQS